MRFKALISASAAVAAAFCIACCSRSFSNPSDPANNGGFYGGIDPVIAGSWDDAATGWPNELVCSDNTFIFKGFNYGQFGVMNAHDGQIFCYYSNATEPGYFFDYSLSPAGDTLFLNEESTDLYTDPSTLHGVYKLTRAH